MLERIPIIVNTRQYQFGRLVTVLTRYAISTETRPSWPIFHPYYGQTSDRVAMNDFNWTAEFAASVVMLAISVIIGLYYGCVQGKQNTVSEYLLGGKKMSVFPITMSLIASHISGVTLLGLPTEVYTYGTQYLIIAAVNVFVIVIVLYIYLPVFYELQFTSVYEYLEVRFDVKVRALTSLIFAVASILYIPIVIYVPALAYNQVTGLDVHTVSLIICVICIFYTTVGGLKAVVWTDAAQSFFTVFSLIFVIILGLIQVGGFGNLIKSNLEGDRIEFFKMNPDPFMRSSFWTLSLGISVYWLLIAGLHPGSVQRFVALPSYRKARNALIFYVIGMAIVQASCGLIGMLIYTKYKDCDPSSANFIKSDKNLVPYFVMDVAGKYPGITGLFISGVVSTGLSTMSAQLNTVAGTIYEDFIVKMVGVKPSDLTASIIMKTIVVITGLVCVVLVIVIEKLKGILQLAFSLIGITSGPLVSVFTLGLCFPWANARGAMWGMLVSLAITTWIVTGAQLAIYNNELEFVKKEVSVMGCPANTTFKNDTDFSGLYRINDDVYASSNVWKIYTLSYMHYNTIGLLVGIVVGLVVSLIFPTEQKVDPKLLTPFIRNLVNPDYKAKENSTKTNIDEHL